MSETIEKTNELKAFSEPAPMEEELLLRWMPQLSPVQLQQFTEYYKLLLEWNAKVNLTRITEPEEVAQKHFADSIVAAELIPSGARVVDVGTGAGFPGVPLKIVRPDIELVLVDSLGKRIRFLEELTRAIGIEAEAVHSRAEDAARQANLREGFDIALSRAVAPMNVLMELTTPFVKPGGASLMYKGSGARDELAVCGRALSILNCRADSIDYEVPWGARTVVRAVKTGNTPKKYPRKAGFIEKAPL